MVALTLAQIAAAIGAAYTGPDREVCAVSTDSRDIPPGSLFIALRGEKFDGHRFVDAALARGAVAAVVEEPGAAASDSLLLVRDTGQALLDLARLYRQTLDVRVVGITGSVGKTTTKEMVACALQSGLDTLKTEENLNNEIGLPKTILQLEARHRAAVLEMGMDGPGQIARMARCALPDVGIVTNIGVSHLEHLGSRENILKAKLELREGMAQGAPLILCGDNDLLGRVEDSRYRLIFYGIHNPACQVRAEHIEEHTTHQEFDICWENRRFACTLPCLGAHNTLNALAAFAAAVELGLDPEKAVKALAGYRPAGMRQRMVERGGVTFVEDCYNASPDSVEAAMKTLGGMKVTGRKIALLSDMLELGIISPQAHYSAGAVAAKAGVELLYCTGEASLETLRGAREAGLEALHIPDKQELAARLLGVIRPGDAVWCKASRGMRLEEVLQAVYNGLEAREGAGQ